MTFTATVLECVASQVVGLYQYRYNNLPFFVPPGHGLIYLAALRLCALPHIQRPRCTIVALVALLSALWTLYGLFVPAWRDTAGAVWWLILVFFLVRGRDPMLFSVTYVLTMSLEFYGTGMGAWHWTPTLFRSSTRRQPSRRPRVRRAIVCWMRRPVGSLHGWRRSDRIGNRAGGYVTNRYAVGLCRPSEEPSLGMGI